MSNKLHAWQYKGHYLFANDRAEAACLMSWKLQEETPMLALEDVYRVCTAGMEVMQQFPHYVGPTTLKALLAEANDDNEGSYEGFYLCPIPLPKLGMRVGVSGGAGYVASASDKDGVRAIHVELDNGGRELVSDAWSYIPDEDAIEPAPPILKPFANMAPAVCRVTGKRHNWQPLQQQDNKLRCNQCGYIIHGPYDKLPDWLKNEE